MRTKILILVVLLVAACSNHPSEPRLRIASAASMTDAIGPMAEKYGAMTGRDVDTDFGASSTLAKQIADGAPADIYISASRKWVDYLKDRHLLLGEPVVIARNRLVCVVAKDGDTEADSFEALAGAADLIAVGDDGVPVGDYTRQAMRKSGVFDRLRERFVGQKDVRSVVNAVESGNAPAGFVYASDAYQFAETLRVAFVVDGDLHDPIEYYAAQLKQANAPEAARSFLIYLQTAEVQDRFAKLGFVEQ